MFDVYINFLMNFAEFPPHNSSAGMADTTTLPAAIIDLSPIQHPFVIIHRAPINT